MNKIFTLESAISTALPYLVQIFGLSIMSIFFLIKTFNLVAQANILPSALTNRACMQCYSYHSFQAKMLCATNALLHVCHAHFYNGVLFGY